MTAETVGQRIFRLRTARGLSQRALSGPGVSYAYVSRLERGQRTASVKALRTIAPKLGVTEHYLEFGRESAEDRLRRVVRAQKDEIAALTCELEEARGTLREIEELDNVLLRAARDVAARERVRVA